MSRIGAGGAAAGGAPVSVAMLQNSMAALQNSMNALQNNMTAAMNRLELNMIARMANQHALEPYSPLRPLSNPSCAMPAVGPAVGEFPPTRSSLKQMNTARVDAMLNFYGLPVAGTLTDKRASLMQHIGGFF